MDPGEYHQAALKSLEVGAVGSAVTYALLAIHEEFYRYRRQVHPESDDL